MPYRVEQDKSGRAGCKGGKPCKGTKIPKGELRFGTRVKIQDRESWAWRHWGCVTERVLNNVKRDAESPEELDGYDELPEELQAKIRQAFEAGHVDEADVPESARKPREAEGDGEEREVLPTSSPTQAVTKHRENEVEHNKEEENISEHEYESSKARRNRKRKAAKAEDAEDAVGDETSEVKPDVKSKKRRTKPKTADSARADDRAPAEDHEVKKKKRGQKAPSSEEE